MLNSNKKFIAYAVDKLCRSKAIFTTIIEYNAGDIERLDLNQY